jgi:excisionase family DNA binding protein
MSVSAPDTRTVASIELAVADLFALLEERLRSVVHDEIAAFAETAPAKAPEGWMSVGTAAAYLDLTPAALRARVARGEVTAFRLGNDGRSLRFKREDLDACAVKIEGRRSA